MALIYQQKKNFLISLIYADTSITVKMRANLKLQLHVSVVSAFHETLHFCVGPRRTLRNSLEIAVSCAAQCAIPA